MTFGHEKLDVYRVSLEYVAWAYRLTKLGRHEHGIREDVFAYGDYDNEDDNDNDF